MPIFDQGYQHWSGELSGHTWRWLAITRRGVRAGLKNRMTRMALLMAWSPAAVLVIMVCIWGLLERQSDVVIPVMELLRNMFGAQAVADPHHYRVDVWTICFDRFLATELYCSMILILLVGPALISLDLRFNALPLYLSRPLRRFDYFLGKLGVIVVFLAMVMILPSIIAYIFGLLFSDLNLKMIVETLPILLASIAYGLMVSVSAGVLVLALSSLSRNSRYVALFWIGLWFISFAVAGVLQTANAAHHGRFMGRNRFMEMTPEDVVIANSDWRPLISYTANLASIGQHLLGTHDAYESISQWVPPDKRAAFVVMAIGPRFPLSWSIYILGILFLISICILNFRIKSLDRLK